MIGDKTRLYAVLKASGLPKDLEQLDFEGADLAMAGEKTEALDTTVSIEAGNVEDRTATCSVMVSGINQEGEPVDINGKQLTLSLHNIGYYDAGNHFVPVVKGTWSLEWLFKTEAEETVTQVNQKKSG